MRNRGTLLLLSVFLFLAIAAAMNFGSTNLHLLDLCKPENSQILYLRLSRVLLGLLAGAGLATAGVIFQGILRNPLAEPYVLGVSSGAGLGAVLAIFFGLGLEFMPLTAFLGAMLTMFLVLNLSQINGRVSAQGLLLSGVIIGAIFSSLLLFFVSVSSNEAMHGITWWLLGSLQIFDFRILWLVAIMVVLGICIAVYFSRDLNAISLGEEEAGHLGVNVEMVEKILFIVASLVSAGIVCLCGIIGFVGLIIPHAVRMLFGSDNRVALPASAICAGAFLIIADTLSRTLMPPIEIPIGVITALIGGPVFIILLRKKQRPPV